MIDPNYWKQQYFLAGKLKSLLPDRKEISILELAPSDAKHMGYLCPEKESGNRLDRYIVLGIMKKELQDSFNQQAEIHKVAVEYRAWKPGKAADVALKKDSVDVALLTAGGAARLGPTDLGYGLAVVEKALKFDGRLLLVAGESDEVALGGKMEAILSAQDMSDLQDLEELDLEVRESAAGQVLRMAGFRLVRVVRDECGLAIGICLKREPVKVKEPKKVAKVVSKKRSSESGPPRQGALGTAATSKGRPNQPNTKGTRRSPGSSSSR